jgi:hypothetical protein
MGKDSFLRPTLKAEGLRLKAEGLRLNDSGLTRKIKLGSGKMF